MKTIIIAFLSGIMLCNITYADSNRVVATYKGGEIKEEEITKDFLSIWEREPSLKGKSFSELPCPVQESITTLAVRTKLMEQEANNKGFSNTPEFKEKIKAISTRLNQEMLIQEVLKNVKIDDNKIKSDYDEYAKNNKDKKEREVAHILVKDEKAAKDVKDKLRKGSKFAEVAKQFSQDEASKDSGGVIGHLSRGQGLPKDFEDKVFSLKVNEVSEPIKTEAGYHILKILSEKSFTVPSFEQAKPMLEGRVKNEALEVYFNDLAKKVDLKITLDCKKEDTKVEKAGESKK